MTASKIELTDAGNEAMLRLSRVHAITMNVFWDIQRAESSWTKEASPNSRYNQIAEDFISSAFLIKAVDIFQWYNGQVISLLAKSNPAAFIELRDTVTLSAKAARRIASGEDAVQVIVESLKMRDKSVREFLFKSHKLWEEEECAILVEIRNCHSHHLGSDHEGKIAEWIKSGKSPWNLKDSVQLINGHVALSQLSVHKACDILIAQISIMDQEVAGKFGLQTSLRIHDPLTRSIIGK